MSRPLRVFVDHVGSGSSDSTASITSTKSESQRVMHRATIAVFSPNSPMTPMSYQIQQHRSRGLGKLSQIGGRQSTVERLRVDYSSKPSIAAPRRPSVYSPGAPRRKSRIPHMLSQRPRFFSPVPLPHATQRRLRITTPRDEDSHIDLHIGVNKKERNRTVRTRKCSEAVGSLCSTHNLVVKDTFARLQKKDSGEMTRINDGTNPSVTRKRLRKVLEEDRRRRLTSTVDFNRTFNEASDLLNEIRTMRGSRPYTSVGVRPATEAQKSRKPMSPVAAVGATSPTKVAVRKANSPPLRRPATAIGYNRDRQLAADSGGPLIEFEPGVRGEIQRANLRIEERNQHLLENPEELKKYFQEVMKYEAEIKERKDVVGDLVEKNMREAGELTREHVLEKQREQLKIEKRREKLVHERKSRIDVTRKVDKQMILFTRKEKLEYERAERKRRFLVEEKQRGWLLVVAFVQSTVLWERIHGKWQPMRLRGKRRHWGYHIIRTKFLPIMRHYLSVRRKRAVRILEKNWLAILFYFRISAKGRAVSTLSVFLHDVANVKSSAMYIKMFRRKVVTLQRWMRYEGEAKKARLTLLRLQFDMVEREILSGLKKSYSRLAETRRKAIDARDKQFEQMYGGRAAVPKKTPRSARGPGNSAGDGHMKKFLERVKYGDSSLQTDLGLRHVPEDIKMTVLNEKYAEQKEILRESFTEFERELQTHEINVVRGNIHDRAKSLLHSVDSPGEKTDGPLSVSQASESRGPPVKPRFRCVLGKSDTVGMVEKARMIFRERFSPGGANNFDVDMVKDITLPIK